MSSSVLPTLLWLFAVGIAVGVLLAMLGFGAYHGLNPGMGWLFALSLGLQQRNPRAIWVSLLPIALGHAAALAVVAVLVVAGAQFISTAPLQGMTALVLIAFGFYKIFNYYRHPRWVGMKVGLRDLTWWSFLMATAHGAGLMLIPALMPLCFGTNAPALPTDAGIGVALLGVLVHSLSMLAVTGLVAVIVYEWIGLAILRSAWINVDRIWTLALAATGLLLLLG